jgi:hypothetical protein
MRRFQVEIEMKSISLAGLLLGLVFAVIATLLSGSWIFWLAVGVAIGVLLGSAGAKRSRQGNMTQSKAA